MNYKRGLNKFISLNPIRLYGKQKSSSHWEIKKFAKTAKQGRTSSAWLEREDFRNFCQQFT